jgi:hypothetical protein
LGAFIGYGPKARQISLALREQRIELVELDFDVLVVRQSSGAWRERQRRRSP